MVVISRLEDMIDFLKKVNLYIYNKVFLLIYLFIGDKYINKMICVLGSKLLCLVRVWE